MKVAITSKSKYDLYEFTNMLNRHYQIKSRDEQEQGDLFVCVYTISGDASMDEMFKLIKKITGVNPYKKRRWMFRREKAVAAFILHHRFDVSYTKIAFLLGYISHSSPIDSIVYYDLKKIDNIKTLPLESVVRKVWIQALKKVKRSKWHK